MAIIRPTTESQVEISLSRNDGEMYYPALFITSSEVKAFLDFGRVAYHPIVVKSAFDPKHYKDLLNYCIDHLGTEKDEEYSFNLEFRVHHIDGGGVRAQFQATGCKLIGYSLPKFDRESGKVAEFELTFLPCGVSNIMT
jgi:hypothetical protein